MIKRYIRIEDDGYLIETAEFDTDTFVLTYTKVENQKLVNDDHYRLGSINAFENEIKVYELKGFKKVN